MGDQQSVDQLTSFFMPLHGIYPAPLSCQSAYLPYATIIRRVGPWRRAYASDDSRIWAFMPLRRIVPLRGTLSCAFGAALLQGPTRRGLSHMGFHTACRIVSCSVVILTRSRRYATIVRRVRPWRRARPKAGIDESASFRISAWQESGIVGKSVFCK